MGKTRSAFSLIELMVAMGIGALLVGLSAAGLAHMVDRSRAVKCLSNLRQLGLSAMEFAQDNNMTLPVTVHQRAAGGQSWTLSLQDYAGGTIVFRCPSDAIKTRLYTYVINDFLTPNPAGASDLDYSRLSRLPQRTKTFLFAEASDNYVNSDHFHFADYRGMSISLQVFADQVGVARHNSSANYVFTDGHVENLSSKQVANLLAQPGCPFVDPTASN